MEIINKTLLELINDKNEKFKNDDGMMDGQTFYDLLNEIGLVIAKYQGLENYYLKTYEVP